MSDNPALDALHNAIQAFSNSLAKDSCGAGVIGQSVIVWEESSFSEEGDLQRQVLYATTGSASPAGTIGLLTLGVAQVQSDCIGCACDEGD